MADVWGIPAIKHWWLPDWNDCPPVVRSIHAFMEDRLPSTEGQTRSDDQRNMSGIFSQLSIGESPKSRTYNSPRTATSISESQSPTFTHETEAHQSLAVPEVDDQGMGSDTSMLDQTRESFYQMADNDVEVQMKLRAQGGP